MTIDLGGFEITSSTRMTIMTIFVVYSILLVGLGLYVKIQSRKLGSDNITAFLTGGGALGAFSIAMITATNSMAGGTMISTPGLGYAKGLSIGLLFLAGMISPAFGLGSVGRKVAIIKDRIGATSFLQILYGRFRNKAVVGALAFTAVFSLLFLASGQLQAGAKAFAAFTGLNMYYVGLILTGLITLVYTLSGGIKSMAKVAVVQGVVMLIATFSIIGIVLIRNFQEYGSLEAAFRTVAQSDPGVVQAQTQFTPLAALGQAIFVGIGLGCVPYALSVSVTYNDHSKLRRGIIISCIVTAIVQGIMCNLGPLIYMLNPKIEVADYANVYVATNLLPSWMGGIIFCGMFAAIQSTLAGIMQTCAAGLIKDFLVTCLKPDMDMKKQTRINLITVAILAVAALLISIKPTSLAQYMINFALGAVAAAWYFPVFLALYWKKATAKGTVCSTICGYLAYVLFYFMSSTTVFGEGIRAWWKTSLGGLHAIIPALLVSFLVLVLVSLADQKNKPKLGYYKVFFCEDYDESYANLNTSP